jgi:beta-lactamase superfamily II metal-dependent hydrolase
VTRTQSSIATRSPAARTAGRGFRARRPVPTWLRPLVALLLPMLWAACGNGGGGTGPAPTPPTVTVLATAGGVTAPLADGAAFTPPVRIDVTTDRGVFNAALNGAAFFSGSEVTQPGSYTLVVTARDGTATRTVSLSFTLAFTGSSLLTIRLLDLGANEEGGGGDAILLSDSSAGGVRHALVDAGPRGSGAADTTYVRDRLGQLGVQVIQAMILSHAHGDHYGAMGPVLRADSVVEFLYNGQSRTLGFYNAFLATAQAEADAAGTVPSTRTIDLGGTAVPARLTVLPPLATYLSDASADASQINEGSLGVLVTKGAFRMFLTGDGEVEANARWRTAFSASTAALDVLKAGHHGANDAVFDNGFSGASAWLDHTQPEVVVISSNGESHPRINALNAYLGLPVTRTYCTSVHGEITIRVDEAGAYTVAVERNPAADCEPGSDATT